MDAAPLPDESQSPFDDDMADSDFEDDTLDDDTATLVAYQQVLPANSSKLTEHPFRAIPEVATPPFNGRVVVVKTKAFQT